MNSKLLKLFLLVVVLCLVPARAQTQPSPQSPQSPPSPFTSREFVALLYELPAHPERRDEIVEQIRKRGIGFPLTDGMRSLVATKSGNDAVLRRTLEEAERRRASPGTETLPPEKEANELLERCRAATLAAVETMPDFIVKQQIARFFSMGVTRNWKPDDNLSVAVSYRQSEGEQYKLLAINGMPPTTEQREGSSYGDKLGGAVSTGDYVDRLASLFYERARTEFKAIDTDRMRSRPTVVYEFVVKKENAVQSLEWKIPGGQAKTLTGTRGRIWIDREKNRVLRLEMIATEIEPDFPITASTNTIDYEWVTINDKPYLLPLRSIVEMSFRNHGQLAQSRNDIRFRGYQKFGAELKVLDEIDEKDFPPDKPDQP